jgi:WD40 repeat protein
MACPDSAVCYSPDANMIATGGYHLKFRFWDASSGELLKTFEERLEGHRQFLGVTSLAWTATNT